MIDEIRKHREDWEIIFVGRMYALEGKEIVSEEYKLVRGRGIRFLPLTTGRLQRSLTATTIASLLKIPIGFVQAFGYLQQERPDIVLSFGGYVAVPVAIAAWILKIPVATHEQTRVAGLGNRMIALFAKRIFTSFPDMTRQFPIHKTVYTGLPLRGEIFESVPKPSYIPDGQRPILYITGGSTGSVTLNAIIFSVLYRVTNEFIVIHQTGGLSYQDGLTAKAKLPPSRRNRYIPVSYLGAKEYAWVLAHADIIIGRSGVNTVMEIAAFGKIAIYIPLPWSAEGEQDENARYAALHGSSVVLAQKGLTGQRLYQTIRDTYKRRNLISDQARRFARLVPRDAALEIVKQLIALV
ncbi:UDP-N-acetylglucosamine--N-acetylmuramyl-(pentapeptide) pyrophosphoryl-undecaprenol N-acetylglucosamine transferase [Patescibacteria group bacterium]|nr:UDP-N-acetylglucosamine--N-acetylmuramyl-(pentapeptide) pyrophosphoryl-undecaprenol N-acetylglucosamine transferase [Patescibacteria group bacterium]MBU2459724.1 UDP-N-acetylglucosamine--N-acetylmuramyl-(pentapeptide) pyrophosphoryl-undecaprenol N-acetylglucosamine transferase [Patescibacteria group bacterium]